MSKNQLKNRKKEVFPEPSDLERALEGIQEIEVDMEEDFSDF